MQKSIKKKQEICEFLSHTDLHTVAKISKHHNLMEKPLKMADFVQYPPTVEAICKYLPKRYKKSASSYHTQTGYIPIVFV